MKNNKKHFILLFQYNCIHLYGDKNGKVEKLKFSNGREKLSNCVTFSYDKEDLEFLPNGDPFEIDSNSSFSDYLDFAGYHFSSSEAIIEIVTAIIRDKYIPGLGKNDDILLCTQSFYYEIDDNVDEDIDDLKKKYDKNLVILGHSIYHYDFRTIFDFSYDVIVDNFNTHFLFADPFYTIFIDCKPENYNVTCSPVFEETKVLTVLSKYPLPSTIPEKLLRNVKNKIVVAKLFNLPLPEKAIYRNQIFDVSHTQLAIMFDELIKENAESIVKETNKTGNGPTYIFDFGMHPEIRKAFEKVIETPLFFNEDGKMAFICFLFRCLLCEHEAIHDLMFKAATSRISSRIRKKRDCFKSGNTTYYNLHTVIRSYYRATKKIDIEENYETTQLMSFVSDELKKKYVPDK